MIKSAQQSTLKLYGFLPSFAFGFGKDSMHAYVQLYKMVKEGLFINFSGGGIEVADSASE